MKQQLRIEITDDGQINVKTIGMNDESCLDYVPLLEKILDAETVHSEFTEEFLRAQQHIEDVTHVEEQQTINRKGD